MGKSHRRLGKWRGWAVLALAALSSLPCAAASSPASNAPPHAVKSPATNAPAGFRIKPGFRLESVATEPAVTAPVAIAFDENGRLFVLERAEAPGLTGTNAHAGRVRLLEDTDGDGEYQSSTVYADNLSRPSALACSGGGIFVAAVPDLLYLKDSTTKGLADVRKIIFSGLGDTNMLDGAALPNNFNWGLDNRIHAASAAVTGFVPASTSPSAALVSLTTADFSFDPRRLTLCAEAGPALSGLTFDDWGRKFTCNPAQPLRTPRYEPRYLARNPFFPPPPLMLEVASPATALFPLGPRHSPPSGEAGLQVARAPAPGRAREPDAMAAAWLTNAQGCVVYRGSAFPTNYQGSVFVADPSAHVIHHFILQEAGLDVSAVRPRDETDTEFVASADAGFCPVQLVNGPDGALYVVDRGEAGKGGRIWRVVPLGFHRPKPPRLGKATTTELVAALAHSNGWTRDTAARLLYERRDPLAAPLLSNALAFARAPLTRVQALHALDGQGALNPSHLIRGLQDPDGRVRKHAVLLSEKLVQDGALPAALWDQLRLRAADASVRVRYQLAFTLGDVSRPDKALVLGTLLLSDPTNRWTQAAVFSSVANGAGDLLRTLGNDPRVRGDRRGQQWLLDLAGMIGLRGQVNEVEQVLGYVELFQANPQEGFTLLYALGDGLNRTRSSLALADPAGRLQLFYDTALSSIQTYYLPDPWRVGAIEVVGVSPYPFGSVADLLLLQVGSGQSEAIQSATLATLGRYDEPRIVPAIAQRWRALTPRLRTQALGALLARSNRAGAVLAGLQGGWLGAAELSAAQANYLRTARDAAIRVRARQLLGPVPGLRPEVMQRFRPALGLRGNAARGQQIFFGRCVGCHQPAGATQPLGSDLAGARLSGRERILSAILEPNLSLQNAYLTYVAETVDGECFIGILRDQNPSTITLQALSGTQVVLPRTDLQYLQAQPWSLMPEGMEAGLSLQAMADLIEYVMSGVW